VTGLVGCPKGYLIRSTSRSALARVLFLHERDSIQICHSLGDALFSMKTPPLNDELCQSSPPTRPGENTGSSQALTYPPEWNSYPLRLVEKGESPGNWTVTLLLHYGEVHSRHDRSTSYRSARRTRLATQQPTQGNRWRRSLSLIARASRAFYCFYPPI
jgi:hypothetical protein